MRTLTVLLTIVCIGCAKAAPSNDSTAQASLASQCEAPSTVTHDFVNWPSQTSSSYNCPNLYPKMNCHYYVGQSGVREMVCDDIDVTDPQGVPDGYVQYAQGTRDFFDGFEGPAVAFDGGYQYDGLRCFYFVSTSATYDENIVCQ